MLTYFRKKERLYLSNPKLLKLCCEFTDQREGISNWLSYSCSLGNHASIVSYSKRLFTAGLNIVAAAFGGGRSKCLE